MAERIDPNKLAQASKAAMGAPWVHRGRSLSEGVDCLGLAICLLRESGADVLDLEYPSEWWGDGDLFKFHAAYHNQFEEVAQGEQQTGDVVSLKMSHVFTDHVGVMLDPSRFIHAGKAFGVCISRLSDQRVSKRISAFYRFRGTA